MTPEALEALTRALAEARVEADRDMTLCAYGRRDGLAAALAICRQEPLTR